jgi:hypothetical protein
MSLDFSGFQILGVVLMDDKNVFFTLLDDKFMTLINSKYYL